METIQEYIENNNRGQASAASHHLFLPAPPFHI